MKTLLLALLLVSPAAARADIVFKCRSLAPAEDLSVNLRFDDRGRTGRIEIERWTGYPPTPEVYADLKAPVSRDGRVVYPSAPDADTGARAEISLPLNFLKESDFTAALTLLRPGRRVDADLGCERF